MHNCARMLGRSTWLSGLDCGKHCTCYPAPGKSRKWDKRSMRRREKAAWMRDVLTDNV